MSSLDVSIVPQIGIEQDTVLEHLIDWHQVILGQVMCGKKNPTMNISQRIATETDIEGILQLQSQNLYANLSDAELADGFVTTPFTPDLIRSLLAQDGVFVATDAERIVGYILAGTWDFYDQWEIFRLMIDRLPELQFQGRRIEVDRSFQYGPVCIDRSLRGGKILPQLFTTMQANFALRYPIGVTFINQLNQRSLAAHQRKLNFEIIDEFKLNENSFYTLAFSTLS